MLMTLLAAAGHAWGATDAAPGSSAPGNPLSTPAPIADASLDGASDRRGELLATRELLRALLHGEVREAPPLAAVLGVDPAEESGVAARLTELRQTLESLPHPSKDDAGVASDASRHTADASLDATSVSDAGDGGALLVEPLALLEYDIVTLSIRFLEQPRVTRLAVVDAQAALVKKKREHAEQLAALAEAEQAMKLAQAAQAKAASDARDAATITARTIAETRASLEGVRVEQAKLRRTLAAQRQDLDVMAAAHAKQLQELAATTLGTPAHTAQADALYDTLVAALREARVELGARLDAYSEPTLVAGWKGSVSALAIADAVERSRLESIANDVAREQAALLTDVGALRWRALEAAVGWEGDLNKLRLEQLGRLSTQKRDRVLGLGPEGLDQLQRELLHVRLLVRWGRVAGTRLALERLTALRSPGAALLLLTRVALFGLMVYATRRTVKGSQAALSGLREMLTRTSKPPWTRFGLRLVAVVEAVIVELVLLGAVLVLPLVTGFGAGPMTSGLYAVLVWFAVYRIALAAAHRGIVYATLTGVAAIDADRSELALRTARLIGRVALAFGLLLVVSAQALGKGYLYHLVARLAWLGVVPVAFILLRGWRRHIADAYLAIRGAGALADRVRSSRDRWFGFFIALAAFAFLVVLWALRFARSFVLGFDQSRKALAYLFRRRLERQVEGVPEVSVAETELPADLASRLALDAVEDEELVVDHFPGLEQLEEALAAFRQGKGSALLVVGRTGFGKSTWLRRACRRASEWPTTWIALHERVLTVEALVRTIGGACRMPADVVTLEELARCLGAMSPQLVVLDDAQLLMLRAPGALSAWRALAQLIEATRGQVMFLLGMAHYGYEYLRWVRRGDDGFRTVIRLPGWTEEDIAQLLQVRTKAAGYEPSYQALLEEELDGPDAEAALRLRGRDYNRLLWDHAEGSPRVALRAWAASIGRIEDKVIHIRLFRGFPAATLESLTEDERLVLVGIVWHERATVDELVRSLRLPSIGVETAIAKLLERGALGRVGTAYRLEAAAWPVALRYLRRRHFLTS